ncbi:hypothetical protein [Sulfitobacter pacificus]|uniref:hypothetical protein n=1 Tax=Sulfitobacter pacificus TaxID=1499314 RepID=UPI0033400C31
MTDISKEAVERLGNELAELGCLGERGQNTLRAQAARIAELEAALKIIAVADIDEMTLDDCIRCACEPLTPFTEGTIIAKDTSHDG